MYSPLWSMNLSEIKLVGSLGLVRFLSKFFYRTENNDHNISSKNGKKPLWQNTVGPEKRNLKRSTAAWCKMALGKYLHCVLLTVFLRKASADALISILLVNPRCASDCFFSLQYNALIFGMKCRFFSVSLSELSFANKPMSYLTPLNSTN